MEYLVMKSTVEKVEDTPGNVEICKKYCGSCPTYKANHLNDYPPQFLFCARGKTSIAEDAKPASCYCPACELFTKEHLIIGHFCMK